MILYSVLNHINHQEKVDDGMVLSGRAQQTSGRIIHHRNSDQLFVFFFFFPQTVCLFKVDLILYKGVA